MDFDVGVLFGVGGLIALVMYFLPTMIAVLRGVNGCGVFFLNLLLGWTLIGWVVALAMSFGSKPRRETYYIQQPPHGGPQPPHQGPPPPRR